MAKHSMPGYHDYICVASASLRLIYLQGTKLACGEGGCGACAVKVEQYDTKSGDLLFLAPFRAKGFKSSVAGEILMESGEYLDVRAQVLLEALCVA